MGRLRSYIRPDARGTYPIIPYFQNIKIYTGRYTLTKTDKEKETLIWDVNSKTDWESKEHSGELKDLSWTLRVQRDKDSIHRHVDGTKDSDAVTKAITLEL